MKLIENIEGLPASARSVPDRKLAMLVSDLLPLCDFLCIFAAASLSTLLFRHWPAFWIALAGPGIDSVHATLVAAMLVPFVLYDRAFGAMAGQGRTSALVRGHVIRIAILGALVCTLASVSAALVTFSSAWLSIWFVVSVATTSLVRFAIGRYAQWLRQRGVLTEVVAVVGAGPVADRLVRSLRDGRSASVELLGIFDERVGRSNQGAGPPDGTIEQLVALRKTRRIDWIVLTLPSTAEGRLERMVQGLKALAVPICLCSEHLSLAAPYRAISYVGDSVPVGLLADRPIQRWDSIVKSAEDYVIGAVVALLLCPVLAAVALAIKVDSAGPILFKQRRHARNNQEFDIYKFRTMRWNPAAMTGGGLQQTLRRDLRITRLGRFLRSTSLDELPQLFNVLRGEMSMVGPRPHATNMRTEDRLGCDITEVYAHRHRVKPGITGWAQVNGARGATETAAQLQRRVDLDLFYIKNWSLLMDLKILVLTAKVVLRRTNAF